MSLAHELRVLELPSQVDLLDRLQLLTRFSSGLITVSGHSGAGKTWLAQRYLEAWSREKNQSLLLCHPHQKADQHRAIILSQLMPDQVFNSQDPIVESFGRMFADQSCDVVIVVDDAHRLSDTLIAELWMLVLEAQSNPLWMINVLLFSEPDRLPPVLARLSYGQEIKPVELDISDLSDEEAQRFFQILVLRYVDNEQQARIRQTFRKIRLTPGAIMALGEQKKSERRIIIRSIIGSPMKITAVIALLLLLIGGGYWWWFSQPGAGNNHQVLLPEDEQTAIPTLSGDHSATPGEALASSSTQDDASALPPEVMTQTVTVGNDETSRKRVVISSDVVDALLDENKRTTEQARSSAATLAQEAKSPVAESKSSSEAPVFSFGTEKLKAMPETSYTLQLAAMNTLDEVKVFLNRHELDNKVNVYPVIRSGKQWYIVTYKNYPTIQAARDAGRTLSKPLQALGPWPKPLRQIHRELEREK